MIDGRTIVGWLEYPGPKREKEETERKCDAKKKALEMRRVQLVNQSSEQGKRAKE
jgi:hypothetical protein